MRLAVPLAGSLRALLVTSGPVTIGNLRKDGKLLEVGCTRCWNVQYLDPRKLPFGDHVAVPTAYQRMKCSRCGEKAGYSRPDARIGGVSGQYPKF